jgi:hypothetical protein
MSVIENATRLAVRAVLTELVAVAVQSNERKAFATRCLQRIGENGEVAAVREIATQMIEEVTRP